MIDLIIGDRVTGVSVDYLENHTVIAKGLDCVVILSDSGEYEYLFRGEYYTLGETVFTDGGYNIIDVGGS